MLNRAERNGECLKIEKELYTINIFRYMKLMLHTLDVKINITILYKYKYLNLYLIKHLYGGVHIM